VGGELTRSLRFVSNLGQMWVAFPEHIYFSEVCSQLCWDTSLKAICILCPCTYMFYIFCKRLLRQLDCGLAKLNVWSSQSWTRIAFIHELNRVGWNWILCHDFRKLWIGLDWVW